MGHLLYLMFRCDFDVMENLESLDEFGGSVHSPRKKLAESGNQPGRSNNHVSSSNLPAWKTEQIKLGASCVG